MLIRASLVLEARLDPNYGAAIRLREGSMVIVACITSLACVIAGFFFAGSLYASFVAQMFDRIGN